VGVALSGGIDSSLVAALSAKHYPGQIHAFTVGYPGQPESDERPIARRFAEHLGIPFTEVIVSTEEVEASFVELVMAYGHACGGYCGSWVLRGGAGRTRCWGACALVRDGR